MPIHKIKYILASLAIFSTIIHAEVVQTIYCPTTVVCQTGKVESCMPSDLNNFYLPSYNKELVPLLVKPGTYKLQIVEVPQTGGMVTCLYGQGNQQNFPYPVFSLKSYHSFYDPWKPQCYITSVQKCPLVPMGLK